MQAVLIVVITDKLTGIHSLVWLLLQACINYVVETELKFKIKILK